MYNPSWKYFLNYETLWMSREELVEATYEAAFLLNRVKAQHNLINSHTAEKINMKIQSARSALQRIDEIIKIDDSKLRTQKLEDLRSQIKETNQKLLCSKDELLRWPLQ
jgi:hypothetical protein